MSKTYLEVPLIQSLIAAALPVLLISCGDGSGDPPQVPHAFNDTGLIDSWEGACRVNNGLSGSFSQRVREFRSDLTFSFIINIYTDANCSERAITTEFVGRYNGGNVISIAEQDDVIEIDLTYESAFLTLQSQQVVNQFNSEGFNCPTSAFVQDVSYDVTDCNTTFEDRLLPVATYSVFRISEDRLGISDPSYLVDERILSVEQLDFEKASNLALN